MASKNNLNLGNIIKYKDVQGKLKTPIDNYIWSSHRTAKYTKLKLCKRSYLRIQNYQIVR